MAFLLMPTIYITCHPAKEEFANGYALGLNTDEEEGVEYEVCVTKDCPPGQLYMSDKPFWLGNGTVR